MGADRIAFLVKDEGELCPIPAIDLSLGLIPIPISVPCNHISGLKFSLSLVFLLSAALAKRMQFLALFCSGCF